MNMNKTQILRFESLPTEILFQIFSFFAFDEIFKIFFGLNSYLNSTIRSINDGNIQVHYNDLEHVNLIHLFSIQIRRLIIIHSPDVNFTLSINLRSLTLKYGTIAQIDQIRPKHFPMLEILHIYGVNGSSVIEKSKTINDLFDIIFCNGFAQLRICTASGIEPLNINEMLSGSSTLRHMILDGQTELIYEKLNVLCPNLYRSNSLGQSSIDFITNDIQMRSNSAASFSSKRILAEITKLKQFQSEKTFLLDYWSIYGNNGNFGHILGGRIFPKSDPYCLASFRIEIQLYPEYPFKSPNGRFLDPIYHPVLVDGGRHCCCWSSDPHSWIPSSSIAQYITGMINIIDHPDQWVNHGDSVRYYEYISNHSVFYEKALRSVFKYGQSRFFISSNKIKD